MCRDSKQCKMLNQPSKRKVRSKSYLKYQRYIKGKSFKQIRELVLERDNWRCQCCGRGIEDGIVLTVHHKTYAHLYNEKEHLEDLICLCEICHKAIHSAKGNIKRFRRPDEDE